MALYESEGVPAPNVSLDDNSACVELVEGRSKTVSGLVWLLEDECAKPKVRDASPPGHTPPPAPDPPLPRLTPSLPPPLLSDIFSPLPPLLL